MEKLITKRKFLALSLMCILFVFMTACGSSSNSTSENQTDASNVSEEDKNSNEEKNGNSESGDESSKKQDDSDDQTTTNEANSADENNSEVNSEATDTSSSNKSKITDGDSAIEYLKNELQMTQNEDILFDDMGGTLESDTTGSYYMIKLTSKDLQKDGGIGTVGLYKVYQDGNYQLSSTTTSGTQKEKISDESAAIKYLKKELEMENNSDIEFSNIGGSLKSDDAGSFYKIKLTSKSIQENGGSGTVGLYKVYQDGTYQLSSKSSTTSSTDITSETAAIEYLKSELKMESNSDIEFSNIAGSLQSDDGGSFYKIQLTSKSIQENGGSGTVGLYKVYQDGNYQLVN